MAKEKEAIVVRIYISEAEQWQGKPLYTTIVEEARNHGLAGATVIRGIEGFGLRKEAASTARSHAPLVIEIIDWGDKAQSFLEALEEMVQEGLVTTQSVQVVSYRSRMP